MIGRRHTPDQIIRKLAEGHKLLAGGTELDEVYRHLQIAESTWHRWVAQYGGMKASDAKRLKEIEGENARSGSPSGGHAGWSASTDRPSDSTRRRSPMTRRSCARSCGRSPRSDRGGGGGEPPGRPAGKAGRSTTSASRIQRLWREEGLKVPYRKRKKPHRGIGTAVGAMCPIVPNALWALDFQLDTTVDGRTLKLLNVVDEFTRECPAIVVDRSIDADKVVDCLDRLMLTRGAPVFVRFDNGPEFIANAVADWCRFNGVGTCFIDPGSPWQNAWIESFNGRLRDEFLNGWQFDNLLEAQVLIEDWRIDYNEHRPHSAHGDLTPGEFAQA